MATQQQKRAWKLLEFVAHGSNVTCLALSPNTGRVMVTGGEDRKVNFWAVGKPNVIMSLSGHTSTVESVKFNSGGDVVVAGSQSGTLKIWDLEAAKIIRTLTGHKTSVKCMDFHPFGDFVASGSLDTDVKLWDIRRKGCIFTYKGHAGAVNNLKFSPDGRWIISSGIDCTAKLWDLTTGKLVNDFKAHTGPVNAADFHPREFFLATASSDRTVKFWDLESFQLVSSTQEETTAIRCIGFHADGSCIFSGGQDSLRVYGWEPVTCYDKFSVQWGSVADIVSTSDQLIGGSFCQSNVSVWVVDLSQVSSSVSAGNNLKAQQVSLAKSPPRRAFNTERPPTTSTKPRSSRIEQAEKPESPPAEEKAASEEGMDQQSIFTARKILGRTPPAKHEPFPAPLEDQQAPAPAPAPVQDPHVHIPVKLAPDPVKPVKPSKTTTESKKLVPSERAKPADLQMSDFLPKPKPSIAPEPAQNKLDQELNVEHKRPEVSEDEAVSSLMKSHSSICAIMTSRQKNLNIVSRYWADGEIKNAVQVCVNMDDQAIVVDLLNVLILKQALWNLDVCSLLLPQIKELICSKYESYVQAGASAVKLILKHFAPVIKSNMAAPPASLGVDLVREDRYKKCQRCHSLLMAVRQILSSKTSMTGKMGSLFREMSLAFAALD